MDWSSMSRWIYPNHFLVTFCVELWYVMFLRERQNVTSVTFSKKIIGLVRFVVIKHEPSCGL